MGTLLVNMADYKVARNGEKLLTRDLGSCVGVAMWDSEAKVGGLVHIMLPQCPKDLEMSLAARPKYADTGIDLLVTMLERAGASRSRLKTKLAGAAHIVHTAGVPESEDISSKNLNAVRTRLRALNIPVIAMEVGECYPRTMIFDPISGALQLQTAGKKDRFL